MKNAAQENRHKEFAALLASGLKVKVIAERMGLPIKTAYWYSNHAETQKYVNKIADKTFESVQKVHQHYAVSMAREYAETVMLHLKERNLDALPGAGKFLGLDRITPETKDQNLTVVLDLGTQTVKTIEVSENAVQNNENTKRVSAPRSSESEIKISTSNDGSILAVGVEQGNNTDITVSHPTGAEGSVQGLPPREDPAK